MHGLEVEFVDGLTRYRDPSVPVRHAVPPAPSCSQTSSTAAATAGHPYLIHTNCLSSCSL
jgi:hypothetical protein